MEPELGPNVTTGPAPASPIVSRSAAVGRLPVSQPSSESGSAITQLSRHRRSHRCSPPHGQENTRSVSTSLAAPRTGVTFSLWRGVAHADQRPCSAGQPLGPDTANATLRPIKAVPEAAPTAASRRRDLERRARAALASPAQAQWGARVRTSKTPPSASTWRATAPAVGSMNWGSTAVMIRAPLGLETPQPLPRVPSAPKVRGRGRQHRAQPPGLADALDPEIDEAGRADQLHPLKDHHLLLQDKTGAGRHRPELNQLAAVVSHRRRQGEGHEPCR